MKQFFIVTKNELWRYFSSPLAVVYLIGFLVLNGVTAFYFGHFFERGIASLFYMFCYQPWLYLLFTSGIAMRLWAEEFKSKTITQMMTMPVSLPSFVWGKFMAAWLFCLFALLLTFPFVITVHVLGHPDNGILLLSYIASFILSGSMLSISQTMSALTKNQIIALVLGVAANLVFFFSGLEFVLSFFKLFLPDYAVDTIASFSFLTHFSSMINGLLEWRDILFFTSVILLFNFTTMFIISFRTSGTSLFLKSTQKASYITAFIALLGIFIGFNMLANELTRGTELDFTEEKLFTLNKDSVNVLQNLKEPITAKLYFSNILSKRNPQFREAADKIRMLLEHYKTASNGNFDYLIYHPENLDQYEDHALSEGIQPIPLIDLNQNAFFGLSVIDSLNRTETIPYLAFERAGSFEQDLTTLIYKLAHHKKTVGIISSLPLSGQNAQTEQILTDPWEITKKIEQTYNLSYITTPENLNENIDVLMIVHPLDLKEDMVQKIKEYAQNGGKILMFLDATAEARRLYRPSNTPYTPSDLKGLDTFFGFEFHNEYIVADLENSITVDATVSYKTNPAFTQDVIQFKLKSDNFNPFHPVTKNLKSLMMTSVSVLTPLENTETSFLPLLQASDNSSLMNVNVVQNGLNPRQILSFFKKDNNKKVLSAYIRSLKSDAPFDLIVTADSDMLYDSFWSINRYFLDTYYNVSLFNNADFVLNALDFLSADNSLLNLRGKNAFPRPFQNIENIRKQSVFEYKVNEEKIFEKIKEAETALQEITSKRQFEEREIFTADEIALISNLKKNLNKLKLELSADRIKSSEKLNRISFKLKFINILLIPVLIGIIALLKALKRSSKIKKERFNGYRNKALLKLILLSLTVLLLGIFAVWKGSSSDIQKYEDKPTFETLRKQINDVKKIRLQTHDETLTFIFENGKWILKEHPQFPVIQKRILRLLGSLIDATFYEKKSDQAENLWHFGLLPIESSDSTAIHIELSDNQENLIENFELGNHNLDLARGASGAFIRFQDKFQVWLIKADLADLTNDWHDFTYSHLWDLRFGRLLETDKTSSLNLKADYMKYFLNTPLIDAVKDIKTPQKQTSLDLKFENNIQLTLSFYKDGNKYYVTYQVKNIGDNLDFKDFVSATENTYFEITKDNWEKIKNVGNME